MADTESESLFARRLGRFRVEGPLLRETPEQLMCVMQRCMVLRVEVLLANDEAEYTALSEWFKPLAHGKLIPLYLFTVNDLVDPPVVSVQIEDGLRHDGDVAIV